MIVQWVATRKNKRALPNEESSCNIPFVNLDNLTALTNFIKTGLFALNITVGGFFIGLLTGHMQTKDGGGGGGGEVDTDKIKDVGKTLKKKG